MGVGIIEKSLKDAYSIQRIFEAAIKHNPAIVDCFILPVVPKIATQIHMEEEEVKKIVLSIRERAIEQKRREEERELKLQKNYFSLIQFLF